MAPHSVGAAFLKALGTTSADSIALEAPETTIGRDPSCQIVLDAEGSVSRQHAVIYRRGQQFSIADLNSSNGTFVNGQRIQAESGLKTGDRIQFGSQGPQFAFIDPNVANANNPVNVPRNVAPTVIHPPVVAPTQAVVPPPQPPVQTTAVPQASQSSDSSANWGVIIGGLFAVGIVLFAISGLGGILRSIGGNSGNPSTQQPTATNPQAPPDSRPTQPSSQPSQAPPSSQQPQTNPQSPGSGAKVPDIENSFICESTTDQPCTGNSSGITSNSSLALTVTYTEPVAPPSEFRATVDFTSPQGEQRQIDLGTKKFDQGIRSITLPLGKPPGGWRQGAYVFTVEAKNAGGSIARTQSINFR